MGELRYIAQALQKPLDFALMMDNLREERDGGITIDTSQVPFKTDKREYMIIDAPGHKEFTKNMLTGASQADAAVLVIDADQGIQEQTRRHAYLLGLLGFQYVVVVINKMDKVDYSKDRFERLMGITSSMLASYDMKTWGIVPICATRGDNIVGISSAMPWNVQDLVGALDSIPEPQHSRMPFRMAVQGSYDGPNGKEYALGPVLSGEAEVGMSLAMLPEDRVVEFAGVYGGGNKVSVGEAASIRIEPFARGHHILCSWPLPRAGIVLKGTIYWMSKTPLEPGQELILHCSTQYCQVNVFHIMYKIDPSSDGYNDLDDNEEVERVDDGEVAKVEIIASQPIVYEAFSELPELGRFILKYGNEVRAAGVFTE
jgi:sulfate adenylyltransferase subunit 1 (EFTu-like GTPase family)